MQAARRATPQSSKDPTDNSDPRPRDGPAAGEVEREEKHKARSFKIRMMSTAASSSEHPRRSDYECDPVTAPVEFSRDFQDLVLVPLIESRRVLAIRGCLEQGAEAAPRSPVVAAARQAFWIRVRQKVDGGGAARLALQCGIRLLELGALSVAEAFFEEVLVRARDLVTNDPDDEIEAAGGHADATYGRVECEILRILARDGNVRYPRSAQRLLAAAKSARDAMVAVLALPTRDPERIAWLLLNGSILLHGVAEPLAARGGPLARHAAEHLLWAARALDASVGLATIKCASVYLLMYVLASLLTNRRYLPARCRLYALAARACDDAGCPEAARAVLALLGDSTHALRAAEEMQQPLPPPIAAKLRAADEDLAILAVAADAAAYGTLADDTGDPGETEAAAEPILTNAGLGDTATVRGRRLRARALLEAAVVPNARGLAGAVGGPGAPCTRERARRAALARACAEVAAPISGDIPTLDAPQLTSLARTLFVLGERAEFRRVAAIAQGGVDAAANIADAADYSSVGAFSSGASSAGEVEPPRELAAGAAAGGVVGGNC